MRMSHALTACRQSDVRLPLVRRLSPTILSPTPFAALRSRVSGHQTLVPVVEAEVARRQP